MKHYFILFILIMSANYTFSQETDKFQWLEEVENPKALEWAETWNNKSKDAIKSHPAYNNLFEKNLEILNSTERIAEPSIIGEYIYNFWQDQDYERGIWRRAGLKSYLSENPDWEIILNIDELSEKDNIKWVFKGAAGLYPDYDRFLINLSKGGGDAVIIREFDINTKSFVEDGFYIPEAKGGANWIDKNTLMVATDFGEGVTTSGYPRQVNIWKRGTLLENAQLIYNGEETDMGVWGYAQHKPERVYQLITRRTSFYSGEYFFIENEKVIKPELPDDIDLSLFFNNRVIFQLKSDFNVNGKKFSQGSVISIAYDDLIGGEKNYELIFQPDERSSVTQISNTKDKLLLNILNNVKSELYAYSYENGWAKNKIETPGIGTISLGSTDRFSNKYFFNFQNFLESGTLYFSDAGTDKSQKVKSLPSWFPSENYIVEQFETASKDGTLIPYFVVRSKSMKFDGSNPALLYAYGGFELPQLPRYSAVTGVSWLEKGGVYILANLRGGGEFGPKWHQAGLKENRQRVFDDFFAVAEDIIAKKITSPQNLGIYGGSNGGLLVGVAFTQRPELYNAVVCAVPLLDMKRYNKLLAGASWMAEYGNPDIPEEWEYISKYSPYQNLKSGAKYPEVFFYTSTRDDRVHPGHARKMVAKMDDMGYKIYYFENTEGGHAGASTNDQRAEMNALIYTYLIMKLM